MKGWATIFALFGAFWLGAASGGCTPDAWVAWTASGLFFAVSLFMLTIRSRTTT